MAVGGLGLGAQGDQLVDWGRGKASGESQEEKQAGGG